MSSDDGDFTDPAAGANINDTANVDPSHAGSTALMWAA